MSVLLRRSVNISLECKEALILKKVVIKAMINQSYMGIDIICSIT
jgi:hypothetical protein